MTLFEHLCDDGRLYRYVGTIWGPNSETEPGTYFAKIARRGNGHLVNSSYKIGYFVRPNGDISYKNMTIKETVLELVTEQP